MSNALSRAKAWSSVFCLSLAAFVFNTTEFVPVGLLTNIADSFLMQVAYTGLIITVYAWVVALMSLPLTILTAGIERKKLLISLFVIFILSHILISVAWNFTILLIGRIGIACAHAIFWSITTPLAVRLAPNGKRAQAIGFIVAGSSIATVLGVPLGTIVGQMAGWRMTFLGIGVVAMLILAALVYLLPALPSQSHKSLASALRLFKRPVLVLVYVLTAIIVTGHFTAYTYIRPLMEQLGGDNQDFVVLILLCIGFAGIAGSLLFPRYVDRYPISTFFVPLGLLFFCLLMLLVSVRYQPLMIMLSFLWGIAITVISMSLQSKILEAAPDASDVATSMYSGIYNIGIGGGALVGSQVIVYSSIGHIGFVGAIFVAIAMLIFFFIAKRYWIIKTVD
ncbi:sugar transporter [Utexia brackfieldae]|uniref:sugar transporter n=1 Tax=Utexia brackfieldae TaxID=3074108 RepID=UPI00370D7993